MAQNNMKTSGNATISHHFTHPRPMEDAGDWRSCQALSQRYGIENKAAAMFPMEANPDQLFAKA
jgi:hypothetical protein